MDHVRRAAALLAVARTGVFIQAAGVRQACRVGRQWLIS